MERITLDWLIERRACSGARTLFQEIFGQSATIKQIVQELHERELSGWEAWLLSETPAITESLLKHGANVHAYHDFALSCAAIDGRTKTVAILLKHGANVHNYNDRTLRWAAERGHTKTVALLKRHIRKMEFKKPSTR